MLISELKNNFFAELKKEYPEEEIGSFFYLLTESFLGLSRLQLALEPSRKLTVEETENFDNALKRLKKHEPVQHIIGETEFFGLKFLVNENVLIPRPETEELVQWILDEFSERKEKIRILDIGTGSGCIAISLAKTLPNAEVTTIDISEAAFETARKNAKLNGVSVEFIHTDILQLESLDRKYDVIVSNPPYVRELEKEQMHANVLDFEPEMALYVKDSDPLIFYDKITKLASQALNPGGALFFEINQYLADETLALVKKYGFAGELRKDIFGNFRMLKAILRS